MISLHLIDVMRFLAATDVMFFSDENGAGPAVVSWKAAGTGTPLAYLKACLELTKVRLSGTS